MSSPKWKIKNLEGNYSFKRAAEIILKERIKKVSVNIKLYLKEENPKRLHDVRISIRRLRYNLELFYTFFDTKRFIKFYNILVDLQDATGSVRDIYITYENISLYNKEEEIGIQKQVFDKMEERQKVLIEGLRIQFLSFLKSNDMKIFIKLIR